MRCLLLTPFVPYPPVDGGRVRILGLLDALAARCDVDVLSLAREEGDLQALAGAQEAGPCSRSCHSRRSLHRSHRPRPSVAAPLCTWRSIGSRAFPTALAARLESTPYDMVQCEYPYTGQFRSQPHERMRRGCSTHTTSSTASADGSNDSPNWATGRATGPCTASTRDEKQQRDSARRSAFVARWTPSSPCPRSMPRRSPKAVPGLDTISRPQRSRPRAPDPEYGVRKHSPTGLFVGKLDYRPNVDGLRWFTHSILPRILEARSRSSSSSSPEAEIHAELASVLQSPRNPIRRASRRTSSHYLQEAWVIVAPLRAGSGTRLKILEALAAGRAVVTTPIGHEGLETIAEEHCSWLQMPTGFADSVVRLCRDRTLRLRFGRAGREVVERSYGWSHSAGSAGELVWRACGQKPGGAMTS